jgi:hypothetical protein
VRNWISLIESVGSDGYLYHATARENVESILHHGVRPVSYWATEEQVEYYAETIVDEGHKVIIFRALLSAFATNLLEPDHNGIAEPTCYSTMGKTDEQVWAEWKGCEGTWQDSLEIIGAVQYNGVIMPELHPAYF